MPDASFTLEYYTTAAGQEPVRHWIDHDLTVVQRRAVMAALKYLLAVKGVGICASEHGRQLGGGLFELRIRHGEHEIMRKVGVAAPPDARRTEILLRIFCHATGDRVIVLLGGDDKGRHPSRRRESHEVALARRRLRDFQRKRG